MLCPRCDCYVPLEASGYCEACEEYEHEIRREKLAVICSHCGQAFDDRSYERHRWRLHYRGLPVKGRRLRRS